MIVLKKGVWINHWTNEMWIAGTVVQQVWEEMKLKDNPWITSANDGKHRVNSFHYSDQAMDYRTHNIPTPALRAELARVVKGRLRQIDTRYDVLHEYIGTANEHIHIEFDTRKD